MIREIDKTPWIEVNALVIIGDENIILNQILYIKNQLEIYQKSYKIVFVPVILHHQNRRQVHYIQNYNRRMLKRNFKRKRRSLLKADS